MYLLFHVPPVKTAEQEAIFNEELIIVNIDKIKFQKLSARKDYDLTETTASTNIKNVERAEGISVEQGAVDLSFMPNVVPPHLISRLKDIYPKIAEQMDIEASVFTEILINEKGVLININIIGIRLSKSLPGKLQSQVEATFIRDTKKMLLNSRWTPTIINGKKIPIKMVYEFQFKLE